MTPLTLWNRKNHREQDLASRVIARAQQCYFLQEIPGCLRCCKQEHYHDGASMTSSPTILFSRTELIKDRKMFL